jgi:hypothetical protein
MTVRGGGTPRRYMAFAPLCRMGPPPRSLVADAHIASWFGPGHGPPNTSLWRAGRA